MAKKGWEATLEKANKDLKHYGAQLRVSMNDDDYYDMDVEWADGSSEEYAGNYIGSEMEELIRTAWPEVRVKARQRGDRIIRCIVHVDTSERSVLNGGKFIHVHEYCGSEEAAVIWMNKTLQNVLDDAATMVSSEDLISVNAALAKQYDEPANLNAYASIEDITEEVIIKCSEAFCEHHWSHEALMNVVDELGIDLYDIEKN